MPAASEPAKPTKEGYYWIRCVDVWSIAQWHDGCWLNPGEDTYWEHSSLGIEEIRGPIEEPERSEP